MAAKRPAIRGRDDVKAALRRSAAQLFASKGPDGVSLREIAQAAGVNHGLIHRHFGSKEALRQEAMEMMAEEIREELVRGDGSVGDLVDLFENVAQRESYWRSLARALLDGERPEDIQRYFPVIEQLVAKLPPDGPDAPARLDLAQIIAMALGWLVFEPYIVRAMSLRADSPAELRARMIARAAERAGAESATK